jgi:spore coat polysaccharide biosynthesis protein SpsF
MMQVAGFPLAILAGLRAGNTGLEVMLATTKRSVDDLLVEAAISAGLSVYRGETDNVTQRLIDSCKDLTNDSILVRITGDNVLPDGDLIEEVLDYFVSTNQIFTSTIKCQVPYGISVEVMRIGTLKKSLSLSETESDVEHVTPPLDRTFPDSPPPIKHPIGDLTKYRCTVDTQSDFEVIKHLFSTVDSPVSEGWRKLVSLLINDYHSFK